MSQKFEPEPSVQIRCFGKGCGNSIIGYAENNNHGIIYCLKCAENEWQIACIQHDKLMAVDRTVLGDEAFVKLVLDDATVQPAGTMSVAPGKFYILTFNHKVMNITGSSGYRDTPELTWKSMADKIDKYLREL